MYAASLCRPRSGFANASTGAPSPCSSLITPAQLEASAEAPCTSTTVGIWSVWVTERFIVFLLDLWSIDRCCHAF
jgi:hypothetical protein